MASTSTGTVKTAVSNSRPHTRSSERIVPEIDPNSDLENVAWETNSTFGDDNFIHSESFTSSLKSSVLNYTYENGRRYHAFGEDKYPRPNDEDEADRLDLVAHMFSLAMGGKLHLAPIGSDPHRILDVATGTGIWAIDMAEKYPSAQVIGNDISAIQPNYVPPNCQFEISDVEEPWLYPFQFDFIHCRDLVSAIRDWPKLVRQVFEYTKPGGWVEFMDFTMSFYTIQGEFRAGCMADIWSSELRAGTTALGLEPEPGPKLEGWIRGAGFNNVYVHRLGFPVGLWPNDKLMKEIGTVNLIQFLDNLESFSLRLLGNRGWEIEEIKVFLAQVRKDFLNPRLQMQYDGYIVYAQKQGD